MYTYIYIHIYTCSSRSRVRSARTTAVIHRYTHTHTYPHTYHRLHTHIYINKQIHIYIIAAYTDLFQPVQSAQGEDDGAYGAKCAQEHGRLLGQLGPAKGCEEGVRLKKVRRLF